MMSAIKVLYPPLICIEIEGNGRGRVVGEEEVGRGGEGEEKRRRRDRHGGYPRIIYPREIERDRRDEKENGRFCHRGITAGEARHQGWTIVIISPGDSLDSTVTVFFRVYLSSQQGTRKRENFVENWTMRFDERSNKTKWKIYMYVYVVEERFSLYRNL